MSIEQLEKQLAVALADLSSLNALPELLAYARSSDPRVLHKSAFALYRVFTLALASSYYAPRASPEIVEVRKWLGQRLEEFLNILAQLLYHRTADIGICSLDILMSLLKHRSTAISASAGEKIHYGHFRFVAQTLLTAPEQEGSVALRHVAEIFATKWFNIYWDVRWLMLREIETTLRAKASSPDLPLLASNSLVYLERMAPLSEPSKFWIPSLEASPAPVPGAKGKDADEGGTEGDLEDDWRAFFDETPVAAPARVHSKRAHKFSVHAAVHSSSAHRARLSACWITLLPSLTSSPELSARALTILHAVVTPQFKGSAKLMDWVAGCVDYGGSVGLLALNVMYLLMTANNLDYPDFYTRLYAFLDRDCMHMKYRSRFFRLLDRFLSSTHVPTNLLASFVKRLAHLSLSAPPSALVVLIPFIYNVLRRHPQLMVMIHNAESESDVLPDPYDASEPSPFNTRAISSSLWELVALQSHHSTAVSSLARIFSEAFSKPSYSLEDFLDQSYSTLFRSEIRKTLKIEPALQDNHQPASFIGWSLV